MKTNNSIKDDNPRGPMDLICKLIAFAMIAFGGIKGLIDGGDIESLLGGLFVGFVAAPFAVLVFGIFLTPFVAIYDFLCDC
jgi:hypothetical protein